VVRGNLGAIPGTRTWQTKLGSLLKSPSLMEPTTAPGLGHSPLSIPRSSCDGYFLIRAGLFSPMFFFWSGASGLAPVQQRYPFRK
jgi:hypothetical protein